MMFSVPAKQFGGVSYLKTRFQAIQLVLSHPVFVSAEISKSVPL